MFVRCQAPKTQHRCLGRAGSVFVGQDGHGLIGELAFRRRRGVCAPSCDGGTVNLHVCRGVAVLELHHGTVGKQGTHACEHGSHVAAVIVPEVNNCAAGVRHVVYQTFCCGVGVFLADRTARQAGKLGGHNAISGGNLGQFSVVLRAANVVFGWPERGMLTTCDARDVVKDRICVLDGLGVFHPGLGVFACLRKLGFIGINAIKLDEIKRICGVLLWIVGILGLFGHLGYCLLRRKIGGDALVCF